MPFPVMRRSPALLLAACVVCAGCGRQERPVAATRKPPATAPAPQPARAPEAEALDAALREGEPRQRTLQFAQLFTQWLARDIDGPLAYLRDMPAGAARTQALQQLINTVAARDGDRALELAAELATSRDDRYVFSLLFGRFAREDIARATARLERVPREARREAIQALMGVWAQQDHAAALAWAEKLSAPRDREAALEAVLQGLAQRDPDRAVELATRNLDGLARERALYQVVQLLAATDPAAAAKLVPLMPPGDLQMNAACNVARALAAQDVPSAITWVNSLSIEYTRWMALTNVLHHWTQTDPAAAARYVLEEIPPGGTLDFVAPQMASMLVANPQEAIRWCEALPSRSARENSMIMLASTWSHRAPREAVEWAASLRDEPVRTNATTAAFTQWFLTDNPAATKWLERASFPAATKSIMLRSHLIKP